MPRYKHPGLEWDDEVGGFRLKKDPEPPRPQSPLEKRVAARATVAQLLAQSFRRPVGGGDPMRIPAHLRKFIR